MKAAPARALLFMVGLMLIGWGIAPFRVGPVAAAPLMLVTETGTAEPASPTVTSTPANPPPPGATDTPTATPAEPADGPGDRDRTSTPTPTAAPSATPTATPPPAGPGPDPAISKSVSPASAIVGDTVTYTMLVTNLGGAPASGVVVEDTLPGFLLPLEATVSRGGATISGQRVRAEIGDLAPGETVELRVTARVIAPAAAPNNLNLAIVSSGSPDDNPANNQASVPLDAVGPASLPSTGEAESALPLLATALGLALVAGSLLLGHSSRRR